MKILVADDDADLLDVTTYALRREGYHIVTATDGQQAVERCANERPDLVLLDVGLPRMNGFDACRRIREQGGPGGPVIVALTGWGQAGDRRRAAEAGFDGHMVKPVNLAALIAMINSRLSLKH